MRSVLAALYDPRYQERVLVEQLTSSGRAPEVICYREIRRRVHHITAELGRRGIGSGEAVGVVASNSPEWVVADLALLAGGFVEVPVPLAFSAEQARSLLGEVRVCLVDAAGLARLQDWGLADSVVNIDLEDGDVPDADPTAPADLPTADRIVKIIHTSGTTGVPKGVRIRSHGIEAQLRSLAGAIPAGAYERYLSLVPFSLLIEQITGLYLPILSGGRVILLPPGSALLGTAGSRAAEVAEWLRLGHPTAAVLPPAAVSALDALLTEDPAAIDRVFGSRAPFLMAGGAPVDPASLHRLEAAGLPVHEGYGLSENSSVVCWNTPAEHRFGTVGRPLPHCEVKLTAEGELAVRSSSLFAGYTVADPTSRPVDAQGWLHTGDRAEIDTDGFVRILGRLKNVIITSHGRNVSPEWVEARLRTCPGVVDAVVFGDGMEHLSAVLITEQDSPGLAQQVQLFTKQHLAETDQPEQVVVIADGRQMRDRYFTVTGRPRRDLIAAELLPA